MNIRGKLESLLRLAKIHVGESDARHDAWRPGLVDRVREALSGRPLHIPALPSDATRWEKRTWCDIVGMDVLTCPGMPGSDEERKKLALAEKACAILRELRGADSYNK